MAVHKFKPKFTPRMLEDDTAQLCEQAAALREETRRVVQRTRQLIQEAKKLKESWRLDPGIGEKSN